MCAGSGVATGAAAGYYAKEAARPAIGMVPAGHRCDQSDFEIRSVAIPSTAALCHRSGQHGICVGVAAVWNSAYR